MINRYKKKKLWRKVQCEKCPWKLSTDPFDIPDGYSTDRHRALESTIAEPGSLKKLNRSMACHESTPDIEEPYCIGWLFNQLGPGNNLGLRMQMLHYDLSDVKLSGEQHLRFEDTLPDDDELF